MRKIAFLTLAFLWVSVHAQDDDLFDILSEELPEEQTYEVRATFKGTRLINGHSVETRKKKVLEFIIMHRFGRINDGFDEWFGLDQSNIRFGLEYGLTDDLMLAVGRSSFDKTYDGFAKYRLLKQKAGTKPFPMSVTLFGSAAIRTLKDYDPNNKPDLSKMTAYTSQVLIARKFSEGFSFQVSPTYIHRNSVRFAEDPHDIFALGGGGRLKLNQRTSINVEYYHNFTPPESMDTQNVLSVGFDIETGGHVFQVMVSNAITMIERSFITETTDEFFKGDLHFGFNISRLFHFSGKQKRPDDGGDW